MGIYRPRTHAICGYVFAIKVGNDGVYHHSYYYATIEQGV